MANSFLQWNPRMEMMSGAATGAGGLGVADREAKTPNEQQQQERGHETMKQRARKNGKSSASASKKQPQRGLGVAQLERLRLQERWKKITEFDHSQTSPPPINIHDHHFLYQQYQFPFPLADHQPHPRFSDGASFSATAGSSSGARSVYPDHFQMDRTRFQNGNLNLYETSKELSSIQTQSHCCSDQCEMCKKKKHIIHGGNPNHNVAPRKFPETMMSIGDKRDFLGWNLGVKSVNAEKQQDIGKEEEASEIYSWGKAVRSGSVLMEYQFFPQKVDPDSGCNCNSGVGGCSSYTDFFNTGVSATGAAAVEASTTNSLDLSLKLSC